MGASQLHIASPITHGHAMPMAHDLTSQPTATVRDRQTRRPTDSMGPPYQLQESSVTTTLRIVKNTKLTLGPRVNRLTTLRPRPQRPPHAFCRAREPAVIHDVCVCVCVCRGIAQSALGIYAPYQEQRKVTRVHQTGMHEHAHEAWRQVRSQNYMHTLCSI